ncbi:MAG TPA: TylF/MycF/NovP-related O-methyltransferase [Bryobacteraceae bacterium]|jgi:hypothetical protein|nr:TylF/MycF/NovP-related O-methyltransferase [Bryobacteraceae bacterium]
MRALVRFLKRKTTAYLQHVAGLLVKDMELVRQHAATLESAEFVAGHMSGIRSFRSKFSLMEEALRAVNPKLAGLYCEFGVFQGKTINFIASRTQSEVHGFDSFEGLPEDWRPGMDKGAFVVKNLPAVRPNVRLYKGWFNETLPGFVKDHTGPIAFLHLDADLYSSTKTVFEFLGDRIVPSTVIQFDEYFNYSGWQQGEHQAFTEFCAERKIEFRYLGYTSNDEQVAVQIVKIEPSSGSDRPSLPHS